MKNDLNYRQPETEEEFLNEWVRLSGLNEEDLSHFEESHHPQDHYEFKEDTWGNVTLTSPDGRDVYLQGDDATQFMDEINAPMPHGTVFGDEAARYDSIISEYFPIAHEGEGWNGVYGRNPDLDDHDNYDDPNDVEGPAF